MSDDERVTLREVPPEARHHDVIFAGSRVARLAWEPGPEGSCRLHFDGAVRAEVMREIIDAVTARLLSGLPPGTCIVYRGHLVSSFSYGG